MSLIAKVNSIRESYNFPKSVSFMSAMDNQIEITSPNLFITVTDVGEGELEVKRVPVGKETFEDSVADTLVEMLQDSDINMYIDFGMEYIGTKGITLVPSN